MSHHPATADAGPYLWRKSQSSGYGDVRRPGQDPGAPNVAVLVERRYLSQLQPAGMVAELKRRGCGVAVVDPEAAAFRLGDNRWLDGLDLVVCRGRSWSLLALLSWAEAEGVPTLNTRDAISAVHNKADMAVVLSSGKIPTPGTWLGPVRELARRIPGDAFPVILKPIFGDNASGLRVVRTPEALAGTEWPEPVALAQQFVENDGFDLKLYVAGEEVWAVTKPSPIGRDGAAGAVRENVARAAPLSPGLAGLARRCASLFGLELCGLDCIQVPGGALVIEVNDFPNYTAVPGADSRLADYVLGRAGRRKEARR